jgi:Zn-dependent M28 family amino/carboxypeptidase
MKDKSLPRISVLVALVVAISIAAGGQQTQTQNAPSIERLRAHIEYLASDKLEGRRTGSPGANLAAEYIAREFSRYGLRRSIGYDTPGMSILEADSPNRYLQRFPYVVGVELGNNNLLLVKSESATMQARVGDDWTPLGFSSSNRLDSASVVFAGYGITSSELKYDDYAATNAKDKAAVVFSGTPDGDNPHGQFARAGEVRFKAAAARAAGARALVIIASENNFKEDRLSQLGYDNAGEAGIPVLVVSRQTAAGMLGGSVSDLSDFEKAADSRGMSSSTADDYSVARKLRQPSINTINLSVDVIRREVQPANVVGILDGSDPTLKKEVIVIGAHYDHLGRGGEGSLAAREGEIHHGADDNASGVAGMLELARLFRSQESRPRRTIVFIAFSGEEEGLLGSNYYVNRPIMPLANTVAMINMDMIGRMKDNKLIVGGVGTAQGFRDLVAGSNLEAPALDESPVRKDPSARKAITPDLRVSEPWDVRRRTEATKSDDLIANALKAGDRLTGAPLLTKQAFELTLNEDGFGPSDHSSFYAKQVPVLFFWTGTHDDYHKPSDTADKINYADEARILSLVWRAVRDIDSNDKRPVYTLAKSESTGRSTGFRVYLGTIPNYADSSDGLLLDGVRDESPASKAGIKAGDKIVKLAGHEVHNVYDYTYALGEMKAGQEYEVELLRSGERLKLKITPAARK